MKALLKKPSLQPNQPVNDKDPVRLAFLGGPKCGKSALISKLTSGNFSDTYYPLRSTLPILFEYTPSPKQIENVLDPTAPNRTLDRATRADNVVLSPVIYKALVKDYSKTPASVSDPDLDLISSNEIYATFKPSSNQGHKNVTPILTELIDTPSFNPNQIVPFLEASLYIKLDRDVLHNLADEPRRPVNTNPLLVASGAGEMNGDVDGYFFVYTAVPSLDPPGYEESMQQEVVRDGPDISPYSSSESYNENGTLKSVTMHRNSQAKSFNLLPIMKEALDEAWREYYTYKTRWYHGEEGDVFSLKSALKNMLSEKSEAPTAPVPKLKLLETPVDPADPASPPPIWIVCTHKNLPLASPKLIADGKRLAKLWKCGFVALDLTDDIEDSLAWMIRDLVERKKIQKNKKRKY